MLLLWSLIESILVPKSLVFCVSILIKIVAKFDVNNSQSKHVLPSCDTIAKRSYCCEVCMDRMDPLDHHHGTLGAGNIFHSRFSCTWIQRTPPSILSMF